MPHYLHYDVFTNRPFEGNQLAVFPNAQGLSAEQMQTITREMNFSECTFLLPAETSGTDVRMRIFTPGAELPMAGHPTIGTTFALANGGVIAAGAERFVFGLGVGPTVVELAWRGSRLEFAWMDQKTPDFRGPASPVADILQSIGVDPAHLDPRGLPVQEVSCGVPFIYVPLASRAAVDDAEPDLRAMRALRSAFPEGHNAVFLFAMEPAGSDVTVYSRMFAPDLGVAEDAGDRRRQRAARLLSGGAQPGAVVGMAGHGQPAGRQDAASQPHSHAHHRRRARRHHARAGRGTGSEGRGRGDRERVSSRVQEFKSSKFAGETVNSHSEPNRERQS